MAYVQGQKPANPKGRPKGSKNKVTRNLREWVYEWCEGNQRQFKRDLDELTPKERIDVFLKLLSYCLPRLQAVQAEIKTEDAVPNFYEMLIRTGTIHDEDEDEQEGCELLHAANE